MKGEDGRILGVRLDGAYQSTGEAGSGGAPLALSTIRRIVWIRFAHMKAHCARLRSKIQAWKNTKETRLSKGNGATQSTLGISDANKGDMKTEVYSGPAWANVSLRPCYRPRDIVSIHCMHNIRRPTMKTLAKPICCLCLDHENLVSSQFAVTESNPPGTYLTQCLGIHHSLLLLRNES